MMLIYISLGSNLGSRAANIERAIAALPGARVRVLRRSSLYETEPVDLLDQPWFLNCVVEGETSRAPQKLLQALREIAAQIGPSKTIARGPRVIDLDILLYGDRVIATLDLEIPHPRMANRRFVLVPLAELAPGLHHPSLNATIEDLLAATPDRSEVRVVS